MQVGGSWFLAAGAKGTGGVDAVRRLCDKIGYTQWPGPPDTAQRPARSPAPRMPGGFVSPAPRRPAART